MYNQFFGLRENPFNVNPDPRYLFLTRQTKEAWDGLTQGILARKGLLLLTGEVGTGKTTLLNHLLDWLHQQRAPTAFIFNSHLEISHLFEFMLSDFAVKFDARLKDNTLLRLHQWLWERYRAGDTPVVIVDEAQGLPDRVLEEIRMLLNLETSNEKLLQIVLAGQPELEARFQQPELRQVKQRIALRCKTAALSLDETHQYVLTRMQIAGADGPRIFAPDAMDAVHFYSRGIPRVMNLLCEHALINAGAAQVRPVPARFIAEVASEFQFDDARPFAPSSNFAEAPSSHEIPAQSRFLNALVSLSTTHKHEPPAPQSLRPSVIPVPHWHASPDNILSSVHEFVTPLSHLENFQDAAADDVSDAAPSAQPSEPGLPSRTEHPTAPPLPQVFGSSSVQAFATRSDPPFAPAAAHAFAPPREQTFATRSEQARARISEQNFAARSAEAVAAISDRAISPPFDQLLAAPVEALHVQPAAPDAPWLRQLEERLLADWTSFFSETGTAIALDPAAEPTSEPIAPTHPPRLHLVEPKSTPPASPAASRRPAPNFQNSAQLASRADARHAFARVSALMKLAAPRAILVGRFSTVKVRLASAVAHSRTVLTTWTSNARPGLLSAATAVARSRSVFVRWASGATPRPLSARATSTRSRTTAYVTQLRTRGQTSARSLYWEVRACAGRCLNFAASIDWPQLWLTTARWLRQPCDPTQWRLHDLRSSNELLRVNHKKM
jgi:general secretion pathway protein A